MQQTFPSWTTTEHLSPSDHENLKQVYDLYKSGKLNEAMKQASRLDTIVREQIPLDIWKEMGGELTRTGEAELQKMKKQTALHSPHRNSRSCRDR